MRKTFFILAFILVSAAFCAEQIPWGFQSPTEQAAKLLSEMGSKNTYAPIDGKTRFLVRAQLKYGLERDDYLHRWLDRPLQQDSSFQRIRERAPIKSATYAVMAPEITATGFDGVVCLFATNPTCQDFLRASLTPGLELTQLYEYHFRNFNRELQLAEKAALSPNAFKIGGKSVLGIVAAAGTDTMLKIKEELVKRHGDIFLLTIPVTPIPRRLHDGILRFDVPEIEKIKEHLRTQLRRGDGIALYDADAFMDRRRRNLDFILQVLVPIVHSVMNEAEFKGRKYLAYYFHPGHENSYRHAFMWDSIGTTGLKREMEIVHALNPDYAVACEWDEENENTHLRPTVYNSFSHKRIIRAYKAMHLGGKPQMLPGDNPAIPNLILAYRRTVAGGEELEYEVCNIPDGTFAGKTFSVDLRLTGPDGKELHHFPEQKIASSELTRSIWFTLPSVALINSPVIIPSFTIRWEGGEYKVPQVLSPQEIQAHRNRNYKWVKQPLRDLATGIKANLNIIRRNPDGSLVLKATVDSPEPLRSVELIDGDDTVYIHAAKPEVRENESQYVIRVFHQALQARRLDGSIEWKNISNAVPWQYKQQLFSIWAFSKYITIPKTEISGASATVKLPGISAEVKMADVIRHGTLAVRGDGGTNLIFSRWTSQNAIPAPLMQKNADFTITLLPGNPARKLFYVQCVDQNYRISRQAVVADIPLSGKTRTLHIFDRKSDSVMPVEVDSNLVNDFTFRFAPELGGIIPTAPGRIFNAIAGGSAPQATGLDQGESHYGSIVYRPFGRQKSPVPAGALFIQEQDGSVSAQFDGLRHIAFPQQLLPPACGFELTMRIMPAPGTEGRTMGIVGTGEQAFNLQCVKGVPTVFVFCANRYFRHNPYVANSPKATGPALKPGEWNTLSVRFDGTNLTITVNGVAGPAVKCPHYQFQPTPGVIGCDSFFNFFQGKIADLSIRMI